MSFFYVDNLYPHRYNIIGGCVNMKNLAEKAERLLEAGGVAKDIVLLSISGCAVALSLVFSKTNIVLPFGIDAAWISIVLCGFPIILEAAIGLITRFDIKADVLVSIAIAASVFIGEDFAAGEVAFIMQLGSLLEDLTAAKAESGIKKLVCLTPQTARLLLDSGEKIIPAQDVKAGDILRVFAGETIPVDGIVTLGQTSVNQAVMTGESLPVDKSAGDKVFSGTVNQYGVFEMKAEKVGEDSSIQRMINLVQSADAKKAKIVRLADKWATWIVIFALSASALTWIFSGQIIRAVTILVVFCPCALVLATPTAIMAAIGNVTSKGFLVKEGDALERLSKAKIIAFDKTGTLTYGVPQVTEAKSVCEKYSDEDIFAFAFSAERMSEHPLGKAIVRCYKAKFDSSDEEKNSRVSDFKMTAGRGVSAFCGGKNILAGNAAFLSENKINVSQSARLQSEKYFSQGATVILVAVNGELSGFLVLSDTLRKESADMILSLTSKKIGVQPVLLTGDNKNSSLATARKVGITQVKSDCLPEDKLNVIEEFEKSGQPVCMVGDGINDAPALKRAFVSIAMGGIGSDIAIEAADIALINDEVQNLPHLFELSKQMMKTIRLNLTFSMTLNFLAIALAVSGILNPVWGALVHNAGSVLVILNSSFLLKFKSKAAKSQALPRASENQNGSKSQKTA